MKRRNDNHSPGTTVVRIATVIFLHKLNISGYVTMTCDKYAIHTGVQKINNFFITKQHKKYEIRFITDFAPKFLVHKFKEFLKKKKTIITNVLLHIERYKTELLITCIIIRKMHKNVERV